ncbi:MAG: phosphoribosylanthranilate isomerase [Desulfobacterales bacterium]
MNKADNICGIKICGITEPETAAEIAELGVQAIGLVFYPKSRRCVTPEQALEVRRVLPEKIQTIGVFVNEPADMILKTASQSGLTGVQLHGQEPPEVVSKLKTQGLMVIKALYTKGSPSIAEADQYAADAYLIECAQGKLPGGNAMAWNWQEAAGFGDNHPFILAGGLTPENVASAICDARPHVVDVSSGVEAAPGKKDMDKVRAFVYAVQEYNCLYPIRRIFNANGR